MERFSEGLPFGGSCRSLGRAGFGTGTRRGGGSSANCRASPCLEVCSSVHKEVLKFWISMSFFPLTFL